MFSYYGSKSKVVHLYPKPKFDKIIEPFAGSARYSLKYFDRDVLLVDKYEVIVKIWKWLQQASPKDILSLPVLNVGDKINRDDFDCIEQAWFMGFIINQGVGMPRLTVSPFAEDAIERQKKFAADNLFKIKHWKIELGSYEDIPNQEAAWFIDPPYQFGGEYYWTGNKHLNYPALADWCKAREGQIIVCENTKADWLPFYAMRELNGTIHQTTEAIWSNYPHNFMARQSVLFE
jgi:site-specific DNA-adenine methylase